MSRSLTLTLLKLLTLTAVVAAILDLPGLPERRPRFRVYVVDASLSVRAAEGEAASVPTVDLALSLIERDVRLRLDPDDTYAVVVFAGGLSVTEGAVPRSIDSEALEPHRTNTAGALAAALAMARADRVNEIVLFSDGHYDEAAAEAVARGRGIPILTVPLGATDPIDARIAAVDHPTVAAQGAPFEIRVEVASTHTAQGTLRLEDQALPVRLLAGARQAFVLGPLSGPGRYTLRLDLPRDSCPENNVWPFIVSPQREKPSVWVLSGFGDASPAAAALQGAARVTVGDAWRAPDPFDAVVLEEIAADALDGEALRGYVRDGGVLLTLGGGLAYALGGYAGTPVEDVLPLSAFPRDELALAIVLDASGSMGVRVLRGDEKRIVVARRRIMEATEFLSQKDRLALITFSKAPDLRLPPTPLGDRQQLRRLLETIKPDGPTHLAPAVRLAAEALRGVSLPTRLAVFITDGETQEEHDTLAAAFEELRLEKIAAAAIVTAPGGLEKLKDLPGLKVIPAAGVDDLGDHLKEIFARSKRLILEDPSQIESPVPVAGIRKMNRTDARDEAQVIATADGAPLAATRRVGRGRTAAMTTALTQEWGGSPALLRHLFESVAPRARGEAAARFDGESVTVRWSLPDPTAGEVTFVQGSNRGRARLALRAPDVLEATVSPVRPGPLTVAGPSRITFEVPHSPELTDLGRSDGPLRRLSLLTGGAFHDLEGWSSPGRTRSTPGRFLYAAVALILFVLVAVLSVVWK